MIGWLAARLVSAGVVKALPDARRFAIIGLVVSAIVILGIGGCMAKRSYDRSLIAADRLEATAKGAQRDLRADRAAGEVAGAAEDKFAAEQAKIKEVQDDAVRNDPAGAARPVGPSARSYYDSLPDASAAADRKTTGRTAPVRK